MRGNKPIFRLKLHVSVNISVNSRRNYHKPLQTMTRTTTNDDMNHHKSQITTNHHKPWHKPPWTMTETSTKHDMNHYKSPQTMTWTIMMTQKELCIKPYGFLVNHEKDHIIRAVTKFWHNLAEICGADFDRIFFLLPFPMITISFQTLTSNNKVEFRLEHCDSVWFSLDIDLCYNSCPVCAAHKIDLISDNF